ncbi:hypothetical protein HYFRA_00002535 [Hymenoscyphus fraxineus]|uniref:Methyltransferase type 11 domain-containing protein n=1 Tax=Hymenoscyphus fraxineus TaxID=746836 RepID=A0A9N9PV61_9HELO|nr:hypothetical protein HYFRA_00002535 [Hymenoscyphus fraxineus]
MATFSKTTFNALSYAAFRPSYPPKLFQTLLTYHRGSTNTLLDLGCGPGLISRSLSPSFKSVLGTDPSPGMIAQAKSSTPPHISNIQFREASAENLGFIEDGSLDMVVAGQAAHWFDFTKAWRELGRKVRKGGTVGFWGYVDNVFVDYPAAFGVLMEYCYAEGRMGPFWEKPGRNILRDRYRDIVPPDNEWEDVRRIEYVPGTEGQESGKGELLMGSRMKLGEMEGYARTFSGFHNWASANPGRKARREGGEGDLVDEMFERMLEVTPEWRAMGENWREFEVENEWGSVILLARKS